MKRFAHPWYFTLICFYSFLFCSNIIAQDKTTATEKQDSYFKLSGSYLSNNVYNGRKDSLVTPYITPTFGYYDKSGFYVSGALSYLSNASESRIDLFSLDMGYDFNFSDKFSGSVYANKSFYNQASTSIKSDIKGSMGLSTSYDFNLLQINAGIDLSFATKTDIGINLGAAHAFSFGDDDNAFSLTPTITMNLSTLNFYEGYTNRKIGKNIKKLNPNIASSTSTTTVDNKTGLTLMNYEFSLPFTYDLKKVGFFITPTLSIPQNPIYTTTTTVNKLAGGAQNTIVTNSTPLTEKTLSNTFYAELGLYVKF